MDDDLRESFLRCLRALEKGVVPQTTSFDDIKPIALEIWDAVESISGIREWHVRSFDSVCTGLLWHKRSRAKSDTSITGLMLAIAGLKLALAPREEIDPPLLELPSSIPSATVREVLRSI